jgi:hypothetical protein
VVVLTLGLVEVWRDLATGLWLNVAPPLWCADREPERFRVHLAGHGANLAALESVRDLLGRVRRRPQKLIVTVSPVPLDITFTGEDAAIANSYSKSVLRSVAGEFTSRHADAAYFPSHEMVTLSERRAAFIAEDLRDVRDAMVGAVTAKFLATYLGESGEAPDFNEEAYLDAHPDVDALVRSGALESGFEHWRGAVAEG